jgi:hypothetical protein
MSTCPKCGKDMPTFAPKCPHCGYDFPLDEQEFRKQLNKKRQRHNFAESDFASVILGLSIGLTALGSIVSLCGMLLLLTQRAWIPSLSFLVSAIISAALSITFSRILDLE